MQSILTDLDGSNGQVLAAPILAETGKKILARGHCLTNADISYLGYLGVRQVWINCLEVDEASEAETLAQLTPLVAAGALECRTAPAGRVDFVAAQDSALVVHTDRIHRFNHAGVAVLGTRPQFSRIAAGERAAFLRSRPFASQRDVVNATARRLAETGPCVELIPYRQPVIGVLYTDPVAPSRAQQLFEPIARQRVEAFRGRSFSRTAKEDLPCLQSALRSMIPSVPDVILVASTVAPITPGDALGQAIQALGGQIESFLVPMEPGSLIMLAYLGNTAVVSAPGCLRSHKFNGLDVVLAPLMARHRVQAEDLACLGIGGIYGPST